MTFINYLKNLMRNSIYFLYKKYIEILCENSAKTGIAKKQLKPKLIVSLTSYGDRVKTVHLAIESIFQQTKKADKVILWLDYDKWNDENIPETLKRAKKRGLEVKFCKDIKSYTKLIPTLLEYPDNTIITFDDDILYFPNVIKKLYEAYKKQPKLVHCMRAHRISFDINGKIKPYRAWDWEINKNYGVKPSLDILPTGVAGILYPPGCFHEDVTNEELFMKLCPTTDDVWFKTMTLLKNVEVNVIKNRCWLLFIDNSQDISLCKTNKVGKKDENINIIGINNEAVNNVFDYYKLWNKFSRPLN